MKRLINAIGFQTGWWASIVGVGHGLELPAMALCGVLVGLHLRLIHPTAHRAQEIKLTAVALGLGIVVDSVLQYFSIIQFYGWVLWQLSPFWLWMLWVLFAMTLNSSLAWLQALPLWLSALVGGVFGPLTYLAGARFAAAAVSSDIDHIAALALAWAVALPALVAVAKQLCASTHNTRQA
jgi:hypothetical protein